MGIDESGRGPLAGPVVAAAVVFKYGQIPLNLNDSKKIPEAKRLELFRKIIVSARSYSIRVISHKKIDAINILQASKLAMKLAAEDVLKTTNVDLILIDGNQKISLKRSLAQLPIIKGDGKIQEIMAASILAKVYRDGLMMDLDKKYPHYGFSKHKGYGTKQHLEAIQKYGPCAIHRMSFSGVITQGEQATR